MERIVVNKIFFVFKKSEKVKNEVCEKVKNEVCEKVIFVKVKKYKCVNISPFNFL